MSDDPPKNLRELIDMARAKGHDAFGFSRDPELRAVSYSLMVGTQCSKCSEVKRIGTMCRYKEIGGVYCDTCGFSLSEEDFNAK